MESKKDIYSFWIHYTTKNEEEYFRKFIAGLVSIWESQLNLDWGGDLSLPDSTTIKPDVGPHLSRLPEELLPAIGKFLYVTKDKIDKDGMSSNELKDAELLVRTLILISRNFSNIPSVAAADYVHLIISVASSVMLKIVNKETKDTLSESISFCIVCCHLLECLYDPFFTWRFFKNTRTLAHYLIKYKHPSAAPLHIEVIPFVFELFERKIGNINPLLAFELLNVLGAVVSGSQDVVTGDFNFEKLFNALSGVCPATASLLTAVIADSLATIEIRMTAVKCFVIMIYNLLSIEPHQRQIEISTLLEAFKDSMGRVSSTSDESIDERSKIVLLCSMFDMLAALVNICNDENKKVVRCLMVQNFILETILEAMEKFEVHFELLYSCFRTVAEIIKSEDFSKERMVKINGYNRMFRKLKLIDNPAISLLSIFVEMATEEEYQDAKSLKLENSKLIVPLLQLIPSLEQENQKWLCSTIFSICSCNLKCKWKSIRCGTIKAACETLKKHHLLVPETVNQLISLIETLASISVNTAELKHIFNLFLVSDNKLCQYYLKLLQVLSNITRSNNLIHCRSYFDIQSNADGISIPEIKKWPGSLFGFTFHCWFSLNKIDDNDNSKFESGTSSYRRQIFTILTNTKQGMEVNINAEYNLAIIVTTKKEFLVVSLFDFTFEENRWYCLDICYTPGKRPFAQNQISIFIDGIQQLIATVKFSHIPENFSWCRIGAPIDDVSFDFDSGNGNSPPPEVEKSSGLLPSFISHVPNYITFPLRTSANVNPYVKNFPLGMQSTIFGPTLALSGQMGNVCLFQEPLHHSQIRLLYESGINGDIFSNADENSELSNLQSKLVFFYSPLACAFDHAVDLCLKYKIDGRTTASVCNVHCLKESINSIGSVNVFFPFFETSDYCSNQIVCLREDVPVDDYGEATDFAVSNFRNISEVQLEENSVAVVLTIIKNMLKDPVNQEYFIKRHGFAMLGSLMTQVSINLMDTSVLVSVCLLSENVINTKNFQYQRVFYQNVLFNYDIWARCNFEVLQGHAQFLHYFIKKDKKFFKKRFGVQFLLDVIRKYLSSEDLTNSDATKTVRITIIGIINYYIQKEINVQEMTAILNFMVVARRDFQVIEILDMLINHLKNKSCTDQLYLLLYEPYSADLLYALLVKPAFTVELKKSIFRLFMILLRTDRVYERSKLRLQLQDHTSVGLYSGLIVLLPDKLSLPMDLALMILDQIFLTENSGGFAGALTLLNRLWNAALEAKLEAARKILTILYMKPNAPILFAKQVGWQDCICRLLIHHPITRPDSTVTMDVSEDYKLSEDRMLSSKSSKNSSFDIDSKEVPSAVTALVADNIHLVTSSLTSVAGDVSTIVAENILYAANNLTSAAENVSMMVNENIQYAADTVSSVAGNVNSLVTDNINFAAGVVGSAYSLIAHKSSNIEKVEIPQIEAENKAYSLPCGNEDPFTLINFDDLSLSNRSFSNGSLEDLRSYSSHSKCSPSHASKDSISVTSVQSESNDSDVFVDNDEERVIFDISGRWRGFEGEKEEDKEQELCNAIATILFNIMWKGYDVHQTSVWKERGQVLACINMIGLNNALHCSHMEFKLKLLEMLIQAALSDLADAHGAEYMFMKIENGAQLLRWVYDLLVLDPTRNKSKKIPLKLLDGIVGLIDALLVFRDTPSEENVNLVKISFGILLKNASYTDTDMCAIATAKLHTVIQTRKMSDLSEGCYILYLLNETISNDLKERNVEHYSFMVPVMKTLLAKMGDLFTDDVVPNFSIDSGPEFYEKFQELCCDSKWCSFLDSKVKPNYEKYKNSLTSDLTEAMNIFWAECFEAYKENLNARNKLVLESKERFENTIYKPFLQRVEEEHIRYGNVLSQLRNHRILLKKKWKVQKNYLIGHRRAWSDSLIIEMTSRLIVALALIALVRGQQPVYEGNPNYSFEYHVADPTTGDTKSQTETRSGDAIQGSYSLVEPDGTTRTVDYTADDAQGFVAHVTKSAGTAPVANVAPKYVAPVAPVYHAPYAPVAYHAPYAPVAYHAPYAPVYHAPVYHAPYPAPYAYHAPVYHAPVYAGPAAGYHPPSVRYYKK